jgi:hypothetical protein
MLNGFVLNGFALNAEAEDTPLPDNAGSGTLVSIEQTIVPIPLDIGRNPLNARRVNYDAVNAAILYVGAGSLVTIEQIIGSVGEGTLSDVEQRVGTVDVGGTVTEIEQSVIQSETGSGLFIVIEQSVVNIVTKSLVQIEQRVVND